MLQYSLSLRNRHNKTGSAIFILYFGLVALERSTFHQNFHLSVVIFFSGPSGSMTPFIFFPYLRIKKLLAGAGGGGGGGVRDVALSINSHEQSR